MTPETRGALAITVVVFILMWTASALGTWLTGVPS